MTSQTRDVRLVPVTGEKGLAAFAKAENSFPDDSAWPLPALRAYRGCLLLGGIPDGKGELSWAGSAAYKTLADVGWAIVDLVRGDEPRFYELLGKRLVALKKVKRVGLFLPAAHPGIPPLTGLDFSVVGPEALPEQLKVTPHLLPRPGQVRLVWNAGYAGKEGA